MKTNLKLDIMPPIRLVIMGVVCIAGIIFLPNDWWGIVVKIFLALFLIGTIKGAFSDVWEEYETMGAFVTMQLAAFTAIFLFPDASAMRLVAIFLIMLGWFTMIQRVKRSAR
jgi:hypothetical protein